MKVDEKLSVGSEDEMERDSDEESGEKSDASDSDTDSEEGVGIHEDEGEDSGSEGEEHSVDDEDDEEGEEEVKKPTLPTPADGTTLFVRNVSFDATEEDLRTLYVSLPHRLQLSISICFSSNGILWQV